LDSVTIMNVSNQRWGLLLRVRIAKALLCAASLFLLVIAETSFAQVTTENRVGEAEVRVETDFLGDPLPPCALARLGTNRFNPPIVTMLALSADESIVVTLGPTIMAWDAKTGKHLWSKGSDAKSFGSIAAYGFRGICRLPKSGRLATLAGTGKVDFWDFKSGDRTTVVTTLTTHANSIDISPDETLLALGGSKALVVCDLDGNVKYEIANKPPIPMPRTNDRLTFGGDFSYARFTPDGKRLVLVNSEKPYALQVIDVVNGEIQKEIETEDRIVRIDFSGDGKHVAATERDIAVRMYDLKSGQQVWEQVFSVPGRDERYTTDIQFSPNDELIAVGTAIGQDHRIQLLDPATGEPVGALKGHTWKPWCVRFTADGKKLYSTGWDSVIRRWDIKKREQIWIENAVRATSVCAMSPDGQTIAFQDDHGKIHVVEGGTGKERRTLEFEECSFGQIAYSQDSKLLAGGASSKNDIHIFVWELDTGNLKHHWEWPKGKDVHSSVNALSFSRNANLLAACVSRQSACYVFDLPSDKQVANVRHGQVNGVSMSPDGHQFVSAGWDKQIRLWDCATGDVIKQTSVKDPKSDDPRVYSVLFAPDGMSIATLCLDGTAQIWDLDLEKPTLDFTIRSRTNGGSFQYSRNGLWLAIGRPNGGCSVHDARSGDLIWDRPKHGKSVKNVDFGALDRTLLTGGRDGVCYLWNLNVGIDSFQTDFTKLAEQLVGNSPRDAFDAHQALAAQPVEALPAIKAMMDELFAQWSNPDEDELAELNHRINRVAMLLAQIESPEAGQLLTSLIQECPNGKLKKTLFLASKHRKRFLERVGQQD